jgi:hypothetical protein
MFPSSNLREEMQGRNGESAATKSGVVTATGILKIIVENSCLTVAESDFDERGSTQDGGIFFLNDQPEAPFGIFMVKDPIANFQV